MSHGEGVTSVGRTESTSSDRGITVTRSLARGEKGDPVVELAVNSDQEVPMAVRVREELPADQDLSDLRFEDEGENGSWRALDDGIAFSARLEPNGSLSSTYSIRDGDRSPPLFAGPPSITAVKPVESETLDREAPPQWRSAAATVVPEETSPEGTLPGERDRVGRAGGGSSGSDESLDIAFVSNVVYPFVQGGAEKRIHEIGTRLADRGHDVTVYCRHFWDGPRTISHEGMTLRAVGPERRLYVDGRRSIAEAIEFAARVPYPLYRHGGNHDVIVASVFPYFPVLAAKLSALSLDTPLVTTWHEVWGPYWEEYLGRKAPFGKLIERLTAKVPQHPIAVSERTAEALAAIGTPCDRIGVVPNGVDVDRIRSIPPAENGYNVLFAGRLIEDKNVDLLLSAFDDLAGKYDLTLGIVGDGPELSQIGRAHV